MTGFKVISEMKVCYKHFDGLAARKQFLVFQQHSSVAVETQIKTIK
jgi:hypothetical protein